MHVNVVIVAMKLASYALTNRDLRDAYLESHPVPAIYTSAPYPSNISIGNLLYFWWAPTLVYQPVYPRSPSIRFSFLFKRSVESVSMVILLWFIVAQYGK